MTVLQAYQYIESISKRGSVPGLCAITDMLDRIGNPQNTFKVVHVTGTNGKGSFCSMLSAILKENGYKVGVFSSPHLVDIRECITVDGKMISKDNLARITSRLAPVSEEHCKLTQFEFMTAVCFEFFKEQQIDIAVVEVGMGGRLDATNVFPSPTLSVITGISQDHTSWLGNSPADIAKEKAGIIKNGSPVYFGGEPGDAMNVIFFTAKELHSPFYFKTNGVQLIELTLQKSVFEYKGRVYSLTLPGEYQIDNAVKVIDCCEILCESGISISAESIDRGLINVKRPARFEIICRHPVVIYDGGHNPECAQALARSVDLYFKGSKTDVIMGVLGDKDYRSMADSIASIAKRVYTITPDNPRALNSSELFGVFCDKGVELYDCGNYDTALEKWKNNGESPLIVTGSLYSYGDFIKAFEKYIN